jgi:hypothetical protein
LKKVVVETECGEETQFYVSQDVESITIDGEEWVKKTEENEEKTEDARLPAEDNTYLKSLLETILKTMGETDNNHWHVPYKATTDKFEFEWCGGSLPQAIFKL